jgi:hypothetical protein
MPPWYVVIKPWPSSPNASAYALLLTRAHLRTRELANTPRLVWASSANGPDRSCGAGIRHGGPLLTGQVEAVLLLVCRDVADLLVDLGLAVRGSVAGALGIYRRA